MQSCFDKVKKNFGFGCMRLPMKGDEVDFEETGKMVDMFLANGFNYFDTAHGYLDGQSEIALKKCLTSCYPREAYILTNKLSGHYIEKNEDIRPFFQKQLEACGVDYFDFSLMHAQSAEIFKHFKACRAYETAFKLKKRGKSATSTFPSTTGRRCWMKSCASTRRLRSCRFSSTTSTSTTPRSRAANATRSAASMESP